MKLKYFLSIISLAIIIGAQAQINKQKDTDLYQ